MKNILYIYSSAGGRPLKLSDFKSNINLYGIAITGDLACTRADPSHKGPSQKCLLT